jgi:uncharacterized protein YlxW (UPF0749 family)
LSAEGGARAEDVDKWNAEVESNTAAVAAEAAATDAQAEGIPVTEAPVEPSPEEIDE